MKPTFTGITCVKGPRQNVKKFLHAEQDKDVGVVIVRLGEQGFILNGKDADVFLRKHYQVEMPEEFRGKTMKEAQDLYDQNPSAYAKLMEKLEPLNDDFLGLIARLMIYVEVRKAAGADAEGQPIQYRDV